MFVVYILLGIEQTIHHIVAKNSGLENLLAVFDLDFYILDDFITLLNTNQRPQLTKALTSGLLDAHMLMLAFIMGSKIQYNTRSILSQT